MGNNSNKKKTDSKAELLTGTIILCIGIIILTILFPRFYGGDLKSMEKLSATVTEVNQIEGSENKETVFTYKYKGKDYHGRSDQIKTSYPGQSIDIYVDSELPTSVRFENDMTRILVMLRMLSICVIAVTGFIVIKNKSKDIFA